MFTSSAFGAGSLIISEFRLRGPNGANDEFIEIYNDNGAAHTVASISGTGYGIAASDGVLRCTIPNGTVIPARGHFLCTNSVGYSMLSYPEGNGTLSTGDATYATDIPDNAGIALFNNNTGGGSFSLANRFDAVGSSSEANTTYKEGTGYPALTPFSIEYSFIRDNCGKAGDPNLAGPCTLATPKDTDNNLADFVFVDTNGTSAGAGQRLGAPGPETLSAPISVGAVTVVPLDSSVSIQNPPNVVRDFTSVPANNSTFGTIDLRRRVINGSGAPITRLRFRILDLSTFPAASGTADLRPITSTSVVVAGINDAATCTAAGQATPCTVTVQGTTLEVDNTAPSTGQPNGGGFNSSMGIGTITLGTPLAAGASVDIHLLMGLQQTGNYHLSLLIEGLPEGGGSVIFIACNTDGPCVAPTVTSSVRADPSPTGAATLHYTVTFSQAVTGVDPSDFVLTTTGTATGTVSTVTGGPSVYTVTLTGVTGNGTLRLDVADDDTILNATLIPLGGAGAGNGNFTTGEVYTIVPVITSFSGPSATGTGTIVSSFTGGGGLCSFTSSQYIGAPPGAAPIPPVGVPGIVFPQGLFTFALGSCTPGSAVSFTIVYPQPIPAGSVYYKYGPEPGNLANHWYILPATIVGNTATFTITDGGQGDDDVTANGTIVDQGGPGGPGPNGPAATVPTLSGSMLVLLGLVLAAVGALLLRRS